jgi:hypothetical protein
LADKTSVILEVFRHELFTCEQGVSSVDDNTHVAVLYVGLRISVQWWAFSPDGGWDFIDHPAHGLKIIRQSIYVVICIENMIYSILVLEGVVSASWGTVLSQIVCGIMKSAYCWDRRIVFLRICLRFHFFIWLVAKRWAFSSRHFAHPESTSKTKISLFDSGITSELLSLWS